MQKPWNWALGIILSIWAVSLWAQSYELKEGKVTFLVRGSPGQLTIEGHGPVAEGRLTQDGQSLKGRVRCEMAKLSVPVSLRDAHMKEKYLKVSEFPESTFELTVFELDRNGWASKRNFRGKMRLRGVERPVEGVASLDSSGQLEASFGLSLNDYGFEPIRYASVKISDAVSVEVRGQLVKIEGDKAAKK